MGTTDLIINKMYDKYLIWDTGAITCRNKKYPVIKIKDITDSRNRKCIRLEYFNSPFRDGTDVLKEETLPDNGDIDMLVREINNRLESSEWFENADNFNSESTLSFDFPCHLILQLNEKYGLQFRGSFTVYADEGTVSFTAPDGKKISSDTRFDIAVPVSKLDYGVWYELRFRELEKKQCPPPRWKDSEHSIVLTGTSDGISYAVSAYIPDDTEKEQLGYEIKPTRRGFDFRVFNDTMKQIWFKAAWMLNERYEKEVYEEALCSWIS